MTAADGGVGVPLVDLGWQHAVIADEVADGFRRVISESAFINGPDVRLFEREFAERCGGGHCVGVANGTDALELLLRSEGLPPGADVIVPANTFVATVEAVVRAGLRPVLADCDSFHLLGPDQLRASLSPQTAAVVAVHLYGQQADMEGLHRALDGAPLALFEDAAQAHGATRWGAGIGQCSAGAATSFYPGKNLGAYGDAGAVVTRDADRAERVRCLANHGSTEKYVHRAVGLNSRLDTLQAVVLRAKLRHLAEWNAQRRRVARLYDELLAGVDGVETPRTADGNEHAWHLYVVQVDDRDRVLEELRRSGIRAGAHYPTPVHLHPAFASLGYGPGDFPVSERTCARVISLPLFPGITEAQVRAVARALARAVAGAPARATAT
jgi:dTDP-4-amino-4,6-dideoxygalactose transaminase